MTDTPYSRRSYGGAPQPAQLVEAMGASDLSFTISTTVGWTETAGANIGQPLGTSGNFVVVIDRFTASVEKINCSAVNLTTGVVTVVPGDRGYDGTTAQGHVPGGSQAGVQTCWSADEAEEANATVNAVLGQSPSNNSVFTWSSGAPAWVAPASGVAAYAQITTNQTGIVSLVNVSGLTVTFTVGAGQTVKLTAFSYNFSATGGALATDQYSLGIYESSTQLGEGLALSGSACTAMAVITPNAGSHTYLVKANHATGSTAGILGAGSTAPAFLLAEIIG